MTLTGSFAASVAAPRREAALQQLRDAQAAVLSTTRPSTFSVRLQVLAESKGAAVDLAVDTLITSVQAAWLTVDDIAVESAEATEVEGR